MIIYNKKWEGLWNQPKYNEIRNKVLEEFKDLIFVDEGHRYYLHDKELTSVSCITHLYKPEFNTDVCALETYERNFNKPSSKYYQRTVDEIKKMWKDKQESACVFGTTRHEFGESCFYYMTQQYDKILPPYKDRITEDNGFKSIYPEEDAIIKVYEDLPTSMIPILAETKVYREDLGYSGTFDILFYYDATIDGKDEKYSGLFILDWKTNENLRKSFGDKLYAPFNLMANNSLNIYKLQLSLYQMALEKIGLKVIARRLLWLKPNGNYEKIPTESYCEELTRDLKQRKNII